jgi:long-subunit acyl-CoA synthetase (AMP-forming)
LPLFLSFGGGEEGGFFLDHKTKEIRDRSDVNEFSKIYFKCEEQNLNLNDTRPFLFITKICTPFPSVSQGTTGSPKAAVLSHSNIVSTTMVAGRRWELNSEVRYFNFPT